MSVGTPVTSGSRRQLTLWLLCAASLMIILDGTIVTVALPSIQRQLGFSAASLSWVVNAYLIAFGSLLLLAGRLGDLIGRKRMFLAGLAAFTVASLLCGLSASPAILGALLVTAGLMLGVYVIVGTSQYGWGSARTLGEAALAAALLAAFVIRQATARNPLLPLRLFASRALAGANLAQLLVIAAAFGFQVMITLYLQRVLGYGAAASGLGLLPTAAVIGTVALGLSARIAARFGPRAMLLAGLALITTGLALLTQTPVHASYSAQLLPALLIFGAGGGLCLPALASLGMSGATPADAGLASGLFNTTQQIGAALGVAVLSTLAAAQTRSRHPAGANTAAALAAGYHLAFAVSAGLGGAAIVVAAAVLWPSRRRAALAECC
jgi:MFS family permease